MELAKAVTDARDNMTADFRTWVKLARELAQNDVRGYDAGLQLVQKPLGAAQIGLLVGVISDQEDYKAAGSIPLAQVMQIRGALTMPTPDPTITDLPGNPKAAYFYELGEGGTRYGMFGFTFADPRPLTPAETEFIDGVVQLLTVHARGKHHVRTLNNFQRMINHDLRTPVAVALSAMSVMDELKYEISGKPKEMMDRIKANVKYTADILESAADGAKLDPETGYYHLNREIVDVVAMANELVAVYVTHGAVKKIIVTSDIDPNLPVLNLDRTMVHRAFLNLIDNAVKYTIENGTVHVSLQAEGRRLILKVRDSGIGIPVDKLPNLFQRFYRTRQRGTERIKGTGLGLFIVKHIAQRHGGEVSAESELGKGSTFTFWLPMEGANVPGASD